MTQLPVTTRLARDNLKPDARGFLPRKAGIGLFIALFAPATFMILSGCQSGDDSGGGSARSEGRALFSTSGSNSGLDDSEAWSIVIVSFSIPEGASATDPQTRLQAEDALRRVRETGLHEAYLERRGRRLVLAYGRYPGPEDAAAQRDLELVRGIEWRGGNPFAGAAIVPPAGAVIGDHPEYNLLTVKERFGEAAKYTLMVANYSRLDRQQPSKRDLAQFRDSAEEATLVYRRGGEQAFYYHGPNSSSVTMGVFGDEVLDADRGSQLLDDLRRRHPHMLINGAGLKTNGRLEPTKLVGIPEP